MNGSPTAQLQAFAQSVYMMIKNRYYDDITSSDGQIFLAQTVDWVNMLIDELEYEVNADGNPIDWIWVRQLNAPLGTALAGTSTISFDTSTYNNLITGTDRFVQILDPLGSGNVMANFTVVSPEDMSNDVNRINQDLCTLVGGVITFSRQFLLSENNGVVQGDVTTYLPRVTTITNAQTGVVTATNVDIFNTVKPLTLLKLGTVKNAILPDIVQGGLNPSYTQKYNDLLTNAINRSVNSSLSPTVDYDDFGGVRGVY
jgi:hypothetical protein